MKLSDWAKKQGIAYLTAYRWFKDGKLPVQAYQSDSGTIIVQDDSENLEQPMGSVSQSNDVMSLFLKKTVEFSKNNSTIEDFAAFIISNFSLKLNSSNDSPKYSKNKPKTEDVQKHFAKFIPAKDNIDHLKMIKSLIKDNPNGELQSVDASELSEIFPEKTSPLSVHMYDTVVEGVVSRNVEFESTPQQINCTGSTLTASFDNNFSQPTSASLNTADFCGFGPIVEPQLYSQVTQPTSAPRRRGRKPSKKSGQ